jgi:hypothetical protein
MKLPTVPKQPQRATKRTFTPVSDELTETVIGDGAPAEPAPRIITINQLFRKTARGKMMLS